MKYKITTRNNVYITDNQQIITDLLVIADLAKNRAEISKKLQELSKHFIEHFQKLYEQPDSNSAIHWQDEMFAALERARNFKYKHNNKPISDEDIKKWFFMPALEIISESEMRDDYIKFIGNLEKGVDVYTAWDKFRTQQKQLKNNTNQHNKINVNHIENKTENCGLGPRTIHKLESMGYTEEQYRNWTLEQARRHYKENK